MDLSQESVAPRTEDSEKIHKMPECITRGEPKLEAAPPASHGMAQLNCSDFSRTDPLPLGSGGLGPAGHDSPAEKRPAEMNICNMFISPDTIQREMLVMLVKMADGSPPAEANIHTDSDTLQSKLSEMTANSERWMEKFIMNPQVVCSGSLTSDDNPEDRSLDVDDGDDVFQDSIPTVVSVRPEVTEKWMDRFVVDLVECPSVSRTSAAARTFGPAVSEAYSPIVFFLGGGGCRCIPLVVVESDPAVVSDLHAVVSDSDRSVLPVAGFEFPAVFLGKVAFDAVGMGVGPPCFRVDSEEALLKRTDERALLARAAPGATPGMKLVSRSWIVGQGEYTNGIESIKCVPQRTASVWMPLEQACDEESGDADFDSFKTAPWDDGGTQRDERQEVMCRPMVHNEQACYEESGDADFDSFKEAPWDAGGTKRDEIHEARCRPMVHNVDRWTTGNTKCELTMKRLMDTNCPRLESTPGEDDASYRSTDWSAERHTSGRTLSVSGMNWLLCAVALLPADKLYATIHRMDTAVCVEIDSTADMNNAVIEIDDEPILRRRLLRTVVFTEGVEEKYSAPCTDSISTILNSLIFFRANPWQRVVSTEQDMHDSTVKGEFTVSKPCDLLCHRRSLPPNSAGMEGGASVYAHIKLVRRTNFPPNENGGGRSDDYIWLPSESDHSCRRWSLPPNFTLFRRTNFPPNRFVVSLYRYRKFVRRPDPTPEVCAAGRNGGYIRSNIGTVPSVCNEPVTWSQAHGSSHRLGRCDLL